MTQPLIKLLLLAGIALVGYYAVRGSRRAIHRVVWRGTVVVGLGAAMVSVLFPDILTWLALKVGVGRGTDLLLYVMVIAFMLVSVVVFRRISELERKYVALARELAVRRATEDSAELSRVSHPELPR